MQMDSLQSLIYLSGPEDEALINEMKRLMSKVDEMKSQRKSLEDQFRKQVQNDDITSRLVTHDSANQQVHF